MKLYRVALSGMTTIELYVLADTFDSAAQLAAANMGSSFTTDGARVEDLGAPLQWTAPVVQVSEPEVCEPAVPIKESITSDYLICLDDGLKFKSLRRHLSLLGMTPETYCAKWKLPANYPMVAPAYSARRSEMAKSFGLGKK